MHCFISQEKITDSMLYDLRHDADREAFKRQANFLYLKGAKVELTEKKGKRTLQQNSYLHLLLSYFALQIGEKTEYVKQELFKRRINHGYFAREREDQFFGRVLVLRSSADLDTKEMTECIERFRDWAQTEAGIYLPEPNEDAIIGEMEREVQANQRWIE